MVFAEVEKERELANRRSADAGFPFSKHAAQECVHNDLYISRGVFFFPTKRRKLKIKLDLSHRKDYPPKLYALFATKSIRGCYGAWACKNLKIQSINQPINQLANKSTVYR